MKWADYGLDKPTQTISMIGSGEKPVAHTIQLGKEELTARVVEMKTMIRVHLPTSCPGQDILRYALARIPRLVT